MKHQQIDRRNGVELYNKNERFTGFARSFSSIRTLRIISFLPTSITTFYVHDELNTFASIPLYLFSFSFSQPNQMFLDYQITHFDHLIKYFYLIFIIP
jgi:hypothetical protein